MSFNHIFAQSGNILGNGCISIDKASKVELKTSVSAKDQIFVLAHSTSILSVPGVHEGTYKVAGFGNGNIISIGLKLAGKGSLPAWEYNQYSGVLTMRHLSYTKHFHIGQGYSHGYFRVVSCDTTNDALTYSGPIPQGSTKSDKCAICPEIAPKAAGSEPETYTTTYVTIIDGKETTAAAIVNVEHNDEGDVHIHSIPIGVTTDAVKDPFTSAFGVVHQAGVGGIGIGTSTTQDSKPTTVPVNKPGINEINYAPVPEEWELQLEQQQQQQQQQQQGDIKPDTIEIPQMEDPLLEMEKTWIGQSILIMEILIMEILIMEILIMEILIMEMVKHRILLEINLVPKTPQMEMKVLEIHQVKDPVMEMKALMAPIMEMVIHLILQVKNHMNLELNRAVIQIMETPTHPIMVIHSIVLEAYQMVTPAMEMVVLTTVMKALATVMEILVMVMETLTTIIVALTMAMEDHLLIMVIQIITMEIMELIIHQMETPIKIMEILQISIVENPEMTNYQMLIQIVKLVILIQAVEMKVLEIHQTGNQ